MTQRATITDSHCHLDFADFGAERDQIMARAAAAGVARMVTICTKLRQVQTYRHTDTQIHRYTDTQPDKHAGKQADK